MCKSCLSEVFVCPYLTIPSAQSMSIIDKVAAARDLTEIEADLREMIAKITSINGSDLGVFTELYNKRALVQNALKDVRKAENDSYLARRCINLCNCRYNGWDEKFLSFGPDPIGHTTLVENAAIKVYRDLNADFMVSYEKAKEGIEGNGDELVRKIMSKFSYVFSCKNIIGRG